MLTSLLSMFLFSSSIFAASSAELKIRFIGNEAVEISDGSSVILTDFPYESGAFDYMKYPATELTPRRNALCLITHSHADHFDPTLILKLNCKVFGPKEVLNQVTKEVRLSSETNENVSFGQFSILPIVTPHGNVAHFSYLVTWRSKKIYFTGDTDNKDSLLKQQALDLLFVSPWLFRQLSDVQQKTMAKKVVIYHHGPNEKIDCGSCVVPHQNDLITFPALPVQVNEDF